MSAQTVLNGGFRADRTSQKGRDEPVAGGTTVASASGLAKSGLSIAESVYR